MKVSIIIPVYNVAPYIEDSLRSVKEQTYKNIEVILVDDCGTDKSMALAESYLKQYDFPDAKIIRHTNNRGLSAARNTGLHAATGDYVYFLDSDDSLTKDGIAMMAAVPLYGFPYDFIIADYYVIGSKSPFPPLLLPQGGIRNNEDILRAYAEGRWYMMAWNKLCRKEFLLENNLFFEEGVLHEDVIWSFKLACKAQSMYVVTEPTYKYTVRSSSIMTGTSIEKDANQYMKAYETISRFVLEEGLQEKPDAYSILEGRKSTLLFSLLQKGEMELFRKCYATLRLQPHISPMEAFKNKTIGSKYLLRDLHYLLPTALGRAYKHLFYNLFYKWRGKPIEGALW